MTTWPHDTFLRQIYPCCDKLPLLLPWLTEITKIVELIFVEDRINSRLVCRRTKNSLHKICFPPFNYHEMVRSSATQDSNLSYVGSNTDGAAAQMLHKSTLQHKSVEMDHFAFSWSSKAVAASSWFSFFSKRSWSWCRTDCGYRFII